MITKILRQLSIKILQSEENRNAYLKYDAMRKTDGWVVHQGFIIEIANKLSEYMLSKEFTKLDMQEKDAQQRGLYVAKEIIDFLLNPLKGAEKHADIVRHNKKMGATLKGSNRKEK